jgi:hypothetical protein
LVLELHDPWVMRLHDLAFLALVASGAGWTLTAIGFEILAAGDGRSLLWLACSRLLLALACGAFAVALGRTIWRARHALLGGRWILAAAALVVGLAFVSVGYGHVVTAWLAVAIALATLALAGGRLERLS